MNDQSTETTHTGAAPQIHSTPSHLKLLRYLPKNYGGITPESGIVVIFPENERMMEVAGDQGMSKSSTLACLYALLGGDDIKNAVNSTTGKKEGELEFELDGQRYISKLNTSGFTLKSVIPVAGKETRVDVPKPLAVLKSLIGGLGRDPQFLKQMDAAKQIIFIKSMMPLPEDFADVESQVQASYASAFDNRTEANREVSRLRSVLETTGLFVYDDKRKSMVPTAAFNTSEEKFAGSENRDQELQEAWNKANIRLEKSNELTQAQNMRIKDSMNLSSSVSAQELAIADLEAKLESAKQQLGVSKKKLDDADKAIESAKVELETYNDALINRDAAAKAVSDNAGFKLEKHSFETAKKTLAEYQEKAATSTSLSQKLEELSRMRQNLVKKITPQIEGLEVCVPSSVDLNYERETFVLATPDATEEMIQAHLDSKRKSETRHGIFYKGRSVQEMSESELWDLWLQICRINDTKAVFIDNMTSLGTDAVKRINELAASGCFVFYTVMERGAKLSISFLTQIK